MIPDGAQMGHHRELGECGQHREAMIIEKGREREAELLWEEDSLIENDPPGEEGSRACRCGP